MVEITWIIISIKITYGEVRSNGQPARSDRMVSSKEVESPSTQAKVLDNVKELIWFSIRLVRILISKYHIHIHICMDEISIYAPLDSTFDTHQTVLL